MHTGTLKKLALALTFWLALHLGRLHAQLVGPYGTAPITFGVDSHGLLSDTGTLGTGTLSLSGAGTRMFWYPGKAAFRAGAVTGTEWNDSNIGQYSVAFGYGTKASGTYSTAFGVGTTASGMYSTVFGWDTVASSGYSLAAGCQTTASGYFSTAMGLQTTASGSYSTASGYGTVAASSHDFVVGRYNTGGGTASSWVATEPLFEVGNGSDLNHLHNAVLVLKNGNTKIYGTDNEMPNQTLVGTSSVLTEGLADSRYLAVGGGGATSLYFFSGASATGTDSLALGYNANASGNYASAFGSNTTASAYGSTVLGRYNTGGGSSSSWSGSDPLFEIGNGTSSSSKSDALKIDKAGNETIQGNVSAGGSLSAASLTTTGTISSASLTSTGTVTASVFVTTATSGSGDIPMFGQ